MEGRPKVDLSRLDRSTMIGLPALRILTGDMFIVASMLKTGALISFPTSLWPISAGGRVGERVRVGEVGVRREFSLFLSFVGDVGVLAPREEAREAGSVLRRGRVYPRPDARPSDIELRPLRSS